MKKQVLLITLFFNLTSLLFAQRIITGTVTDEKGEPCVGASIVIKDTTLGTLTDIDGRFSLTVPTCKTRLIVFCIGFDSEEITLGVSNVLDVQLEQLDLPEIVFNCGACLHKRTKEHYINATTLDNGTTQLDYKFRDSSEIECTCISRFEPKPLKYIISKSVDDIHYHTIGSSVSDTTIEKNKFNTTVVWGKSLFVDKQMNVADSTFYLISCYDMRYEDEPFLIFEEKISVPPIEGLKIKRIHREGSTNQIEVTLSSFLEKNAIFCVFGLNGSALLTHQQLLSKQSNTVILSAPNMASGMYILLVVQGDISHTRKFFITN